VARLEVSPVRLALRRPVRTSWGDLAERRLLRVRLSWGEDDFGYGEAAPLEPYDRVPLAAVAAALQAYDAVLRDAGPDAGHGELLAACAAERDLPQALAAIDLALWDRAGRRTGRPVAHLLAAA
jgi:L-alanine-DL-glutamate epimerase-like enolase superfamily enzyme